MILHTGEINDPEEISPKALADAQPFESAFGEFITRCLFSASWQLRFAAHNVIVSLLFISLLQRGIHQSIDWICAEDRS